MGACTSNNDVLCCTTKKYAKPTIAQLKNVTALPQACDLSSSLDGLQAEREEDHISDPRACCVGPHFARTELIAKLSKNQAHKMQKSSRLQKWKDMI